MDSIINGVLGKNQQNSVGIYEHIRKTKINVSSFFDSKIQYIPRIDIIYTSSENLNKLNKML